MSSDSFHSSFCLSSDVSNIEAREKHPSQMRGQQSIDGRRNSKTPYTQRISLRCKECDSLSIPAFNRLILPLCSASVRTFVLLPSALCLTPFFLLPVVVHSNLSLLFVRLSLRRRKQERDRDREGRTDRQSPRAYTQPQAQPQPTLTNPQTHQLTSSRPSTQNHHQYSPTLLSQQPPPSPS